MAINSTYFAFIPARIFDASEMNLPSWSAPVPI